MDCNKFEECGLLYVAGELDPAAARGYEAHVETCVECRRETEAYRWEHAELYTVEALSVRPGPAVDAEILRLCSNVRTVPTAFMPALFLKVRKYAPVPVFLMLMMAAVGGYLSYHAMTAESLRAKYAGTGALERVATAPEKVTDISEEIAMSDTGAASSADTNVPTSKKQGNLGLEGVFPVNDVVDGGGR